MTCSLKILWEVKNMGAVCQKKENRKLIKSVDGCCQKCGVENNLTAHHIIPVSVVGYKNDEYYNLITLCDDCHTFFHQYYDFTSKQEIGNYINKLEELMHMCIYAIVNYCNKPHKYFESLHKIFIERFDTKCESEETKNKILNGEF